MATVLHTESLPAPQIESAPAVSEPAPYTDGAGLVYGVLLGAALWLIVVAIAFLLVW